MHSWNTINWKAPKLSNPNSLIIKPIHKNYRIYTSGIFLNKSTGKRQWQSPENTHIEPGQMGTGHGLLGFHTSVLHSSRVTDVDGFGSGLLRVSGFLFFSGSHSLSDSITLTLGLTLSNSHFSLSQSPSLESPSLYFASARPTGIRVLVPPAPSAPATIHRGSGPPRFRVSPHESLDPLFSISLSRLISLSLNSPSYSVSLSLSISLCVRVGRTEKKEEELKRKEERRGRGLLSTENKKWEKEKKEKKRKGKGIRGKGHVASYEWVGRFPFI